MTLRAYAATKHAIDTAEKQEDVPDGPMKTLWYEVMTAKREGGGEQD